jgi:hypothetical protein
MKTKSQLKDVFNGPSSLLYQSAALSGSTLVLDPEYDLPVKVDTIEFEQGEPDIEHYKVIGISGDWVSSSEAGDITLSFRVPTKNTDVLKLAYGNDAVSSASVTYGADTFTGNGLVLKNKKITGTWAIVNDSQDQLMILNNTALYASTVMDSDAKGVVAIDFRGTIESDGTNPDILFLRKNSSSSSGD